MAFVALEAQIAELTTQVNALTATYRTKAETIDAAVDKAIRAIPNNARILYVDPRSGDDTGPGTQARPLQTLKAACDMVPIGGYGTIYLPLSPVVCDIDANIAVRHKSIRISPLPYPSPAGAQADRSVMPLIRQREAADKSEAYGFVVDCGALWIQYCRVETVTAATNPPWSGLLVKRSDVMGSHVGLHYCDIRLGSTPLVYRSQGAASVWVQVYGCSIDRLVPGKGNLLAAQDQPAVLGVALTSLPAGLTLADLISGLRRDADGRVYNVLCSEVL
ncbi:hypothetical protein P7L75_01500 (plasmid) [Tistrella mobilis]|uniref:hypothetical protein n=1 Tax=Tistrella mobilis TaxID=171437 RepID=UPI0035575AEB